MKKNDIEKLKELEDELAGFFNSMREPYNFHDDFEVIRELLKAPKDVGEFLSDFKEDDMTALPSLIDHIEKNKLRRVLTKREFSKIMKYKDSEGSPHIIALYKMTREHMLFKYLEIWEEMDYSSDFTRVIEDLLVYDTENLKFSEIKDRHDIYSITRDFEMEYIDENKYSHFVNKIDKLIDDNKTKLSKIMLIENYFFKKEEYLDIFLSKVSKSDTWTTTAIEEMASAINAIVGWDKGFDIINERLAFTNRKFSTANEYAKTLLARIIDYYLSREPSIMSSTEANIAVENIKSTNVFINIRDLSMTLLFHFFNNNFSRYEKSTIGHHSNYIIRSLLEVANIADGSEEITRNKEFTLKMLKFAKDYSENPMSYSLAFLRVLYPKSVVANWFLSEYTECIKQELNFALGYSASDLIKISIDIDTNAVDLLDELENN